jgi:hypothetical protein
MMADLPLPLDVVGLSPVWKKHKGPHSPGFVPVEVPDEKFWSAVHEYSIL